jgi:hypothetical protein
MACEFDALADLEVLQIEKSPKYTEHPPPDQIAAPD